MAYNIFESFGLRDDIDTYEHNWKLVDKKDVPDSDGFMTEYAWYTDGDKHIFMFGDTDITEPDEDYADWVAETEETAKEWFDNYHGFADELEEDIVEDDWHGDADFINKGFDRVFCKNSDKDETNCSIKDITK